jgi:hypothetical protein
MIGIMYVKSCTYFLAALSNGRPRGDDGLTFEAYLAILSKQNNALQADLEQRTKDHEDTQKILREDNYKLRSRLAESFRVQLRVTPPVPEEEEEKVPTVIDAEHQLTPLHAEAEVNDLTPCILNSYNPYQTLGLST